MVKIIFESHATTFDNEKHLASGHNDVGLSPLGKKQAQELGERYEGKHLDAIFCSDLQRSYKTAGIAFEDRNFPIIKDSRLRECDYGDYSGYPEDEVKHLKLKYVNIPFPNGESYEQAMLRMKSFLKELLEKYDGKRIMVIGHRATWYGLEHLIKGESLKEMITASWKWQPGWEYELGEEN